MCVFGFFAWLVYVCVVVVVVLFFVIGFFGDSFTKFEILCKKNLKKKTFETLTSSQRI